ncbi:MAG: STAS/SEC14 domain-containing protein [Cytophagales bacterium]|nr:STAS/SEC14 domain-containing protein [Cytophagales bacterium]
MLHTISHNNPQLIAFEITGRIRLSNIKEVLDFVFDNLRNRNKPTNILCKMENADIDVASFFNAKLIGIVREEPWSNVKKVHRVAVIGESEFLKKMVRVDGYFAKLWNPEIDERFFPASQSEKAWEFVNDQP